MNISDLTINKSIEEKLLSVLDIQENYIIWLNRDGSFIVLSDNFFEEKIKYALNSGDLLKVIRKINEKANLTFKEKYLEITTRKEIVSPYKTTHYTYKMQLAKHLPTTDQKEYDLIEQLLTKQDPLVEWSITKDSIHELIHMKEEITIKNDACYYITDQDETIFVPKDQIKTGNTIEYSYDLETIKDALTMISQPEKITYEIFAGGLTKITIELKENIRFYCLLANNIVDT